MWAVKLRSNKILWLLTGLTAATATTPATLRPLQGSILLEQIFTVLYKVTHLYYTQWHTCTE